MRQRAAPKLTTSPSSRTRRAIGRPLTPAVLDAVRNTLHAASSNDEAREHVRAGTLTTELRPVGLGPLPATPAKRTPTAAEKKRAAETARVLKAARASEAALKREVEAAGKALDRAEQVYARAREATDAAAGRAQEARRRLREARDGLADAQRRRNEIEADR